MSAALEALTGLRLVSPALLLLALGVPLALWLRRREQAPAIALAPLALRGQDGAARPPSLRARLVALPRALVVLALLLVLLALARPVERQLLPRTHQGIDILLCLDVSSSMAVRDLDAERTRLDVARAAALDFVAARPHDRIGLVTFARYPDLRSPPTLDHGALASILEAVELVEREGPEDATGIGAAVARAVAALAGVEEGSRVVILLTDGEENVATGRTAREIAPLHAAQLALSKDVRVYSIAAGIGDPDGRGGLLPLDTGAIEELAQLTGGRFFQARDAAALAAIYAEIDALEQAELSEPRFRTRERFDDFVLAALALLALAGVARVTLLEVLP